LAGGAALPRRHAPRQRRTIWNKGSRKEIRSALNAWNGKGGAAAPPHQHGKIL